MIRVLHVLGSLDIGGAETFVMNVYDSIDTDLVQFDFVIHTEKECDFNGKVKDMGGIIYNCPRYTGLNHFSYIAWWKRFFKEHPEYKTVHVHVRSTAKYVLAAAKSAGRKTLSHAHSISNGKGIAALVKTLNNKGIYKHSDICLACSEAAGVWQYGAKVTCDPRFHIVKNGIDIRRFSDAMTHRDENRRALCVEDRFVVGHVGNFTFAKNHRFLLDVFKDLIQKRPDSVLLLVGDGDGLSDIKEYATALGISDNVHFLGRRTDVETVLSVMDVFVFPSIWEGFGIAALEAQAAGVPVVISDTVPKEVLVSSSVFTKSLDDDARHWSDSVLNAALIIEGAPEDKIRSAGFDIKDTAQKLIKFYL